ncbi:alpha/beta hydrolase [Oceanobacillus arenosus]|uniref:Alpha/beta hydrolase n=1 Tax=Oceanobacillus arenosus TaxID=1229153 RepID=A0A3D8PS72_9BACI|nr:alpha/beta hydrolase [Oceanobacillus arenosus]RDW18131.1 alpha/beta hydrolase [Oceanobacillus arenosus]
MKRKKFWWRLGIALLSLLFILDIIAGFFFYNLAIERNIKDFLVGNADLEVSAEAMDVFIEGDWRTWAANQDFEQWEMESYDGLKLKGYYLEAEVPTNKTVVFAHGYLGSASDMALFGQYYYEELGYNMFTADLRGHGQSEGDYIGFGWHDRLDYLGWINRIVKELGPDTEIVLHGVSMGAATVLMTSGEELPSNVKAVVADSPYTSVADLFGYQLERMFHLPKIPIIPTTGLVTKFKAGYSLKEASALEQVKKAEVPILYIHGKADAFVPTEMTMELYENTKSDAELLLVDGAGHGEAIVMDHDTYVKRLEQFLGKYVVD